MMTARLAAIVPVKPFARAKSRLESILDQEERARLMEAMLTDVLSALAGVPEVDGIWVVTADAAVASRVAGRGASVIREPFRAGQNRALAAAVGELEETGHDDFLVLSADLPCLTAACLAGIAAPREALPAVILAPDRHGRGTNAMRFRCSEGVMRFRFGPDSLSRHTRIAKSAGLDVILDRTASLACDVDTPDDLDAARRLGCGPATRVVLEALGRDGALFERAEEVS